MSFLNSFFGSGTSGNSGNNSNSSLGFTSRGRNNLFGGTTGIGGGNPFNNLESLFGGSGVPSLSQTTLANNLHVCLQNTSFVVAHYYKEKLFNCQYALAFANASDDHVLTTVLTDQIELYQKCVEELTPFDTAVPYVKENIDVITKYTIECYLNGFKDFEKSSFLLQIKQLHKYLQDMSYYSKLIVDKLRKNSQRDLNSAIENGNEQETEDILTEISIFNVDSNILKDYDYALDRNMSNVYTENQLRELLLMSRRIYLQAIEPIRATINAHLERQQRLSTTIAQFNENGADAEDAQGLIQEMTELYPEFGTILPFILRQNGGAIPQNLTPVEIPLGQSIVDKIPVQPYNFKEGDDPDEICCICQDNYKEGEELRCFDKCCKNRFHMKCIDVWFKTQHNCPLCKEDLRKVYKS